MFCNIRFIQKICFIGLILIAFTTISPAAPADKSNAMGSGEVVFHPVGFFQFGPMVDIGPRIGTSTFLDAHIRWSYAGLVYQAIETDGFENEADPNGFGVGLKLTHFFVSSGTPHGMYIGGLFEYTWGGSKYTDDEDSSYNWERKWKGYDVMFNIGYRWRFPSGFFMQLGGFAGFHNQYKAEWEYTNRPSDKSTHEDPEGVRLIAMIEFSIGTEFGK
ncbi:MAG: hypothetical protein V1874_16905 [Spirochaetota bacterium]